MPKTNHIFIFLLIPLLTLGACNMPSNAPSATQPNEFSTSVALAVQTQLAQTAPFSTTGLPPVPFSTSTSVVSQTIAAPVTPIVAPCNRAEFVTDVSIPDGSTQAANSTFTKTWRLKNNGTCTWTAGYVLIFEQGGGIDAPATVPLTTGSIPPGATVDVSVNLKTPATAGAYQANFRLRSPDNVVFGIGPNGQDMIWVKIVVPQALSDTTSSQPLYEVLLGKTLSDSIVSDFILQNCYLSTYHYLCKGVGVELSLDTGQKVISVFVYAQGADGFNEYTGKLPYGLTWNDTREVVEQKLGLPDSSGGNGTILYWTTYDKDYKLQITYNTLATNDLTTLMHHILIRRP